MDQLHTRLGIMSARQKDEYLDKYVFAPLRKDITALLFSFALNMCDSANLTEVSFKEFDDSARSLYDRLVALEQSLLSGDRGSSFTGSKLIDELDDSAVHYKNGLRCFEQAFNSGSFYKRDRYNQKIIGALSRFNAVFNALGALASQLREL